MYHSLLKFPQLAVARDAINASFTPALTCSNGASVTTCTPSPVCSVINTLASNAVVWALGLQKISNTGTSPCAASPAQYENMNGNMKGVFTSLPLYKTVQCVVTAYIPVILHSTGSHRCGLSAFCLSAKVLSKEFTAPANVSILSLEIGSLIVVAPHDNDRVFVLCCWAATERREALVGLGFNVGWNRCIQVLVASCGDCTIVPCGVFMVS